MDLQNKLTDFFIVQSTWIGGLIIGLSIGGVAMALERALTLLANTDFARRLQARFRRFLRTRVLMRVSRTLASRPRRPAVPRGHHGRRVRTS